LSIGASKCIWIDSETLSFSYAGDTRYSKKGSSSTPFLVVFGWLAPYSQENSAVNFFGAYKSEKCENGNFVLLDWNYSLDYKYGIYPRKSLAY
jgi:hypothetical protein